MKNFIKADLHRVLTKKSRKVVLIIYAISLIGIMIYQILAGVTDISITNLAVIDNPIYGTFVMLVYIFTIFGDDFRAKNHQAAIGMGVERYQVVLGKFITFTIVLTSDVIFFTVFHTILVAITGHLVIGPVIGELVIGLLIGLVRGIIYMSIAMMFAFVTHTATVAALVYFLMYYDILNVLMSTLLSFPIVGVLKIWNYYSTPAIENFINRLSLGIFDIQSFIVIAVYLAFGLGVSILVFKKRELEF